MTTTPHPDRLDWNPMLLEQLTWHWEQQLRPRLEGMMDEEYFWEPVDGACNVRPRGGTSPTPVQGGSGAMTIDFAMPEPDPPPVTTIAWRIGHLVVGVLGARNHSHFGGPPADYMSWDYAATADDALVQLDQTYAGWVAGVANLGPDDLAAPCGPAEGEWGERSMAELVLHIHREVIHHGAEIALLRDLYAHRS
jgi:hypothetical protein